MGSRQADAIALAERCRKAGWTIVKGSSSIKVYNESNQMFPIHMTYSDRRSLNNATAQLERLGLKEAEAKMQEIRFVQAAENGAAAERTLARKTTAAARKSAAAVQRAAGPYLTEPEDVGIMWFAEKHPAPWMRWVYMTPEIAKYLLENHNTNNRPVNPRQVEHYRLIILAGQWHLTHQGGAMDTEGVLQDCQHRLMAIEAAGEVQEDLKVPMAFFVGMPVENFKAIDEGLLRTAAQLFARGGEKNGSTLQTAVRLAIAYRNPEHAGYRLKMPNEQIVDQFGEDPDGFRVAANHAQSNYKKYHSSPGAVAAAIYLINRANGGGNRFTEAFFGGLRTGRKYNTRYVLDDDDPRNVYRETMQRFREQKKKVSSRDQMAMIILTWNNVVTNTRPRYMKFADDADVPKVLVCADTGPRASACPASLVGEVDGDEDGEE